MRTFLPPTRRRSLMPSFEKNKASAMYVLISFSKNRTARRLDSSIFHLRRNNPARFSVLTSRPTDNVHLRASICHAPARFLSAEPFRRRGTIPKPETAAVLTDASDTLPSFGLSPTPTPISPSNSTVISRRARAPADLPPRDTQQEGKMLSLVPEGDDRIDFRCPSRRHKTGQQCDKAQQHRGNYESQQLRMIQSPSAGSIALGTSIP